MWAGHVVNMRGREIFTGFLLGCPKGRIHWEDIGVGRKIKLNGRKGDKDKWGDWIRLAQDYGQVGCFCEHNNEFLFP